MNCVIRLWDTVAFRHLACVINSSPWNFPNQTRTLALVPLLCISPAILLGAGCYYLLCHKALRLQTSGGRPCQPWAQLASEHEVRYHTQNICDMDKWKNVTSLQRTFIPTFLVSSTPGQDKLGDEPISSWHLPSCSDSRPGGVFSVSLTGFRLP